MAAKLKSISDRIPWFLAGKAALAGAAFLFLPRWAFVVLLVGVYFLPWFRPGSMALSFLLALIFGATVQPSWLGALFLALVVFLVIGVKDFVFVRRDEAYEMLVFLFALAGAVLFFGSAPRDGATALAASFAGAGALYVLLKGFTEHASAVRSGEGAVPPALARLLVTLLLWEWLFAIAALPVPPLTAAALFFFGMVLLTEFFREYAAGELSRRRILVSATLMLVLVSFVLAANRWGL